jgi:anti-anti-sigma regulatory factor
MDVSGSRSRVVVRRRNGQQVLVVEGPIDGSTACQVLEVLAHMPGGLRELTLDLSAVTDVHGFGLDVLTRGLRSLARARRVRIESSSRLLPVVGSVFDSLASQHFA